MDMTLYPFRQPWVVYPQHGVHAFMLMALTQTQVEIQRFGERPMLAPFGAEYIGLKLTVTISGWSGSTRRITCVELEDVLKGVSMKMSRERYGRLRCRYRRTEQQVDEWLGIVMLVG